MSFLTLNEITVEFPVQAGHFLENIAHLILELSLDGRIFNKANLFVHGSNPCTWDADNTLVLPVSDKECILSVYLAEVGDDRQLLGCVELCGRDLPGGQEQIIIPIIGNEIMVLKTEAESMTLREAFKLALNMAQADEQEKEEIEGITRISNALDLYNNFRHHGNLASLEQAISQIQAVAKRLSAHDPERRATLERMALSFLYRFKRLRSIDEIDDAVTAQPKASVTPVPDGDPNTPGWSTNLGASLLATRFEQSEPVDDTENVTTREQTTVDPASDSNPDQAEERSNLGNALRAQFERFRKVEDIDAAVAQYQRAVELGPDGHPDKPGWLNNLGNGLLIRFKHLGCVKDIDNAISQYQSAADLTSDSHPDKLRRLTDLGNAVRIRFERFGNVKDIDKAIQHHQAVVDLSRDDHPQKPGWLANLGNSFKLRFERFGRTSDIEEAIAQHKAAVNLSPGGPGDKENLLANLGTSLFTWYERCGNIGEIEEVISQHQGTIYPSPDGHGSSNPGHSLRIRFKRLANVKGTNKSIILNQEPAINGLNGHPDTPLLLSNLSSSLLTWLEQFGDLERINKQIAQHKAALILRPDDHYDTPSLLHNVGTSFFTRYLRLHRPGDADTAILHFSIAAQHPFGSPPHRLMAAQGWIHAASIANHHSLLAAYECALNIVPLVAWLGISITDRHQHLIQIGAIVRDAAATAISLEHSDKAVEWLEQGRSIVWNQILQLRTPVDQLRNVEPELANRLVHVSRLLDGHQTDPQDKTGLPGKEGEQTNRELAAEWETIVQRVRELPNFNDFLRPPRLSRLFGAAKNGPVVVLNIAKTRCDALAMIDGLDEVVHVPLPNFTLDKATKLQAELTALLISSGVRLRAKRDPDIERGGDNGCKKILAELWYCLVKPVLDSLAFSPHPESLPRIWWCVTGPLAFLPIHAAGVYDGESTDEQIFNYVISSYTPTLSTLIESPNVSFGAPFKFLSIIEPSTGRWRIPNTTKELAFIQSRLGPRDHVVLEGPEATKGRAMKAMKDCNWVHLACHGSQNETNPTKSGLKLRDGDLTLEEIIKQDLPHAEFAFLSACQTTTGDESLPEESAHIAGGMLLAGYRSVVATMWSIQDKLAPEVANEFYGHLMEEGGQPDSRNAAEALHLSVQKLRTKPGIPMTSWIPFVHLGI